MKTYRTAVLVLVVMSLIWGCSSSSGGSHVDTTYNPVIDPANFVTGVDNQYMPLVPGQIFHYLNTTTEGSTTTEQDITVTTTHDTKVILGVTCVVVHDLVTIHGTNTILEDTFDWYAQDKDGTVWYFGEDTKSYEDGVGPADTEGSWEAGVDGAKPGIVMYANPEAHINVPYRQEYLSGVAEDKAEVLSVLEAATVPYGPFTNCIMTKDYSDLEPDVVEHKYFAPGVGQVRTVTVLGDNEEEVLVNITAE
jgi:hypothetical protein